MSWGFSDIKYRWQIATGITLATTTIFVALNTRERVNQVDVIEIALGTMERCLATHYTNSANGYFVAPPEIVQAGIATPMSPRWSRTMMW